MDESLPGILMISPIQSFLAHWFGCSVLLAAILGLWFGDEQFTWSRTTHNLVFVSLLLVGFTVATLLNFKRIKEQIMGVDFFPCDSCSESICDCGDYVQCNDGCYRRWCDLKCAKKDGFRYEDEDHEEKSCSFCRNEAAEDSDLFNFLLKKYNLKRDTVLSEYLEKQKEAENG